jgi:hypothetical protein
MFTGSTKQDQNKSINYLCFNDSFQDPEIFTDENGKTYFKTDVLEDIYEKASNNNFFQVGDCVITGTTTITTDGHTRLVESNKTLPNQTNWGTAGTFKTYFNEELVKTEINEDSVVLIYKAVKATSINLESPYICFKDVYKVIDNKLVKQPRIFGKIEPQRTIEETYLFD